MMTDKTGRMIPNEAKAIRIQMIW